MKGMTKSFYISLENNERVKEILKKEKYLSFSVFFNKVLDDFFNEN